MPKTLIDIDEHSLAAAAEALHTTTKKDTVNAALREAAALAARRRDLHRLGSAELSDLTDQEIMRQAWRRYRLTSQIPARWRGCATRRLPPRWPR